MRFLIPLVSAASLCAQETTYYLALLKPGLNAPKISREEGERIQELHMAGIRANAESGALVAAGPMIQDPTLRGIFIFKTESFERARAFSDADPAVRAGRLAMELYAWSGPVGIGEAYRAAQKPGQPPQTKMIEAQFCMLFRGPNWTATTRPAAGAIEGEGELRAVRILPAGAKVEDPALGDGRLRADCRRWYTAEGTLPEPR